MNDFPINKYRRVVLFLVYGGVVMMSVTAGYVKTFGMPGALGRTVILVLLFGWVIVLLGMICVVGLNKKRV